MEPAVLRAFAKYAKVLAHVAGPSGSGKTTLGSQLAKKHPGLLVRDLDDFDHAARADLFGKKRKKDFTTSDIRTLAKRRQKLLNSYLSENKKKPVVLVGHHIEGPTTLNIPTANRWRLSTTARTSMKRRHARSQTASPERRRGPEHETRDLREARGTIKELKERGYVGMGRRQIERAVKRALK